MVDWKAAVETNGFVFTAAFDGLESPVLDGEVEVGAQCQRVYSRIVEAATPYGVEAKQMVRLDHFTQSQSWLSVRQQVRARFFGKPAPLASTGVPVRMAEGNLLRAAGVAWAGSVTPKVLLDGEGFGMAAISTAVQAGPFIFVSGLLAQAPAPFEHNLRTCLADIARVLQQLGVTADHILRMDAYVSRPSHAAVWLEAGRAALGGEPVVRTMIAAFDEEAIEVNLLLAARSVESRTLSLGGGAVLRRAGGFALAGPGWDLAANESVDGLIGRMPGDQQIAAARVDVAGTTPHIRSDRLKSGVLVAAPAAPSRGSEPALVFVG